MKDPSDSSLTMTLHAQQHQTVTHQEQTSVESPSRWLAKLRSAWTLSKKILAHQDKKRDSNNHSNFSRTCYFLFP
jgi:hypothetical protein